MIGPDAFPNDPKRRERTHLGAIAGYDPAGVSGCELDIRARIARAIDASDEELVEWLCTDQIRGWHAGHRIPAEAYLSLRPALREREDAAFEVVYSEFILRESIGESPAVDEYAWRFPELADRLRRQLAFHRVLGREDSEDEAARPPRTIADGLAADIPGLEGAPEIPGYRILGELGRGGAGVVYKALQLALNRPVALKVIGAGRHASPGSAARFRAEAEAAARFQHPNIIQVYEVGEHEGLGFLTLEYAAGGSLQAAIDGTPQDPAASALLIEPLARAIHYAHGRGIIHRDLKPANIVLTEGGVPKVTDFGLAKLLEQDTAPTVSGTILGTPSYMAPEQLLGTSGDISPAADVYALGAILYEALTGRPPFKGATPLSTLDQVANQEPLAPRSLQRSTPPELETICMKCLEKAPARRYPSAEALADDLRRFLDGRPILARPSPPWEKAAKWARRRPGLAAALAGLALAVAVVFVGILHYNALLRAGVRAARSAKEEADRKTRFALEQRNLAMQAIDKLVFEVQERLGETPATRQLRQSLLGTAIAGLDRLAASTEATPPDMSRAVAHQKLGEIYRQLGRSAEASRQFEQAVRLAEQLAAEEPSDLAVKDCLIRAHAGLGELGVTDGQNPTALGHFQRVVELSEAIAATNASRPGDRRRLVEAYVRLGRAYGFRRKYPEAVGWFLKARALAQGWAAEEPASAEASAMLAWSHRKIGDIRKLSGDLDAARGDYVRAIAIGRESLESHPTDRETKIHLASALNDLAGVLHTQRDLAAAEPLYTEAESRLIDLAGADPENADLRLALMHNQDGLARLLREARRHAEAASVLRRTIDDLRRFPSERIASHPDVEFLRAGVLQRDLADCQSAPIALGPLPALLSKPTPDACSLLLSRARLLIAADQVPRALDALEAVCSLPARGPDDSAGLIPSIQECVRILDGLPVAGPAEARRLEILRRLTDRAASLPAAGTSP